MTKVHHRIRSSEDPQKTLNQSMKMANKEMNEAVNGPYPTHGNESPDKSMVSNTRPRNDSSGGTYPAQVNYDKLILAQSKIAVPGGQ